MIHPGWGLVRPDDGGEELTGEIGKPIASVIPLTLTASHGRIPLSDQDIRMAIDSLGESKCDV
jgi:hypothetical protein